MSAQLVNRFFNEVISQKKIAVLDEILHPSFHSNHFPIPPGSDKAGFVEGTKGLLSAFPDIKITINDQFEKTGKVFSYGTWTATHKNMFQGIPPTNKQVRVEFMDIWQESDGKLRENWVVMDIIGLMIQLGVVPPLGAKPSAST